MLFNEQLESEEIEVLATTAQLDGDQTEPEEESEEMDDEEELDEATEGAEGDEEVAEDESAN